MTIRVVGGEGSGVPPAIAAGVSADLVVDDTTKGFPLGHAPLRVRDIGAQRWNALRDLPRPCALLKESALDNNRRFMRAFVEKTGALIAPHGKTTMAPQLFRRQLDDGAFAITVATPAQLAVCRRFGFRRLFLANQLVGANAVAYVVDALVADDAFELYVVVDSVVAVSALADEARRQELRRPVLILVEGGFTGGRAGCRTVDDAVAVARAVHERRDVLSLVGVFGFEGLLHGDDEGERVPAFLDDLVAIAAACATAALFAPADRRRGPLLLSAGGSAFYDVVVDRLARARIADMRVLLRSGCYLTHDSGAYEKAFARILARNTRVVDLGVALKPALEVWTQVQSRPEPQRAILTAGKRDVGVDAGNPVPLAWRREVPDVASGVKPVPFARGTHVVVEVNDQHAHVKLPADSPLSVGDLVGLGVSHPCTTFDKWQLVYLVDDDYNVTGAIRTFF